MNKVILKHIIRYILIIILIILCSEIFKFSSEDAKKSTSTSAKVAKFIIMLSKENKGLSEKELNIKIKGMQHKIRKCAHFFIYMLLGIILMEILITYNCERIVQMSISTIVAFLYACTDELHQRFVPGRSGQFNDVCLDTLGALVGITIFFTFMMILHIIKEKKMDKTKVLLEKNDTITKKRNVIFIASTGGHLNELMQVKPLFNKFEYHIITERTKVDDSLKEEYGDKIKFLIYGTKKYPIIYIFKFLANCFISLYFFFKYQPEVVVTTGTHTAVPMCYIAKLFGSKVIFIETFANRSTGTVAGKLVYPIADTFVVQWEEMHKVYPKSVCWGWLY